ncbi:GNAT family N-acetyltransferase [Longimicrobium sp.]|uniref:GNAT family N-acetyltransferase n=1 Tax=Longimicrobium sp. TaxID=2029185 RepID=UPI002B5B2EFC|nr:GNAT family N-acetyltransferase [Longimicrobium sp.]HSU15132.1 GNAT family N-acetyltransferase [Longimicrobium sp.]
MSQRIMHGDIVVRRLDGPPEPGFDCGHEEQNTFLYRYAWTDQQQQLSVTYRYYVHGIFAGFAALAMDGLALSFRERGVHIRYETVGALKLGQLGVDRRFQGRGLGEVIVADVATLAREFALQVGCRYIAIDARPGLERWYEALSFKRNKLMQERLRQFAMEKNRDPDRLATSMRFDIRS